MRKTLDHTRASRRGVLKGLTAVVSTAALAGCSTDSNDGDRVLSPQEGLTFDRELKTCYSSGPYNCGARCLHKIHYKNNRLVHLTSAGDIPRQGSFEADNSPGVIGLPIQRRACVRGYSYLQRLYQPDRLKYPLIQTGKKGEIENFRRVDWDTAISAAAKALHEAIQRKKELDYSPIMSKWVNGTLNTFDNFMDNPAVAPVITHLGNESTGAVDAAKYDMVGVDAFTNNISDRLNSKFIITWALDPSRTTYHIEHAHWFNTCAKEQPETDIVVITSNHSDAAAMLSTGVKNFTYTPKGQAAKTLDIPGWIPVRPATDGALAAAMAYVIYKNDLHLPNEEFLREKCFGFYKGQTVKSTARTEVFMKDKNLTSPADFIDDRNEPFSKGDFYTGATFTVPTGASFEEYLVSLENQWGGAAGHEVGGLQAAVGDETYHRVLAYATAVTGVPTELIEALAFKYGTTVPSFLDVGGGPQRAWNGVEWVQMMISLCAMTGNIERAGGGAGYSMLATLDLNGVRPPVTSPSSMLNNMETINAISVPMSAWTHVALTGKDHRSRERFIEDVKITTGGKVDLTGRERMVEIDVWFMNHYNGVTTLENINKTLKALQQVKTVICCDQTMTPSAAYSDIILPVSSHYEKENVQLAPGSTAMFKMDAPLERLYDTRTDNQIRNMILQKLNDDYGYAFEMYTDDSVPYVNTLVAQGTYEALKGPSDLYKTLVDPNAEAKSWEQFCADGIDDHPIPKGTSITAYKLFNPPGSLQNSTGRINFWQPLWGKIRPKTPKPAGPDYWGLTHDGFRNPTACYQPNVEGYETFFRNNDPLNGEFTGFYSKESKRHYKLLYMTNKARNRAHTVFDNVAMIKDQFEQCVYLNPVDAAVRGIKDGDMVYAYNDRGCTYLPARVTHYIIPGVVSIEHGAWYRPHPTEKVTVWLDTAIDADGNSVFEKHEVPVDVGGAENVLTLSLAGTEQYVGQAISAQGGPCEVSLIKPE